MIEIEHSAAYQEFSAWTSSDGSAIFTYLKLYACRHNSLLKSSEVGKIIIGLGKQDFWSGTYERTLLESLSKRWDGLSQTTKKRLETKLLEGKGCENSTDKVFSVLQRITWLNKKGVAFTFNFEQKKKDLKNICPEWEEKNIEKIDRDTPFGFYTITSNEDPKELKGIEDSELIETAYRLNAQSLEDRSKENVPLVGLIKEDPEYVFNVISSHQSEHNDWALELYLRTVDFDDEGFQQKIADKNYQLINKINDFIYDNYIVKDEQNINIHAKLIIGSFIRINEKFGKELDSDIFHKSIKNVIDVYKKHPEFNEKIASNNRVKFALIAGNSNIYHLVNSLIRNSSEVVNRVPSTKWLELAEAILNFQKPLSDYATFAFSGRICWLYYHHPEWVEKHLLSRSMIENGDINNAFWLGFLHLPQVPNKKLYEHIKSGLLLLVRKDLQYNNIYEEYYKTISSIFFLLWKNKYIPDQEIRGIIYTNHHDFISSFIRILPNYCERHIDSVVKFFQDIWPKEKEVKNMKNTRNFLYLLACHDAKYFKKIYGVIGNYLSVIDSMYGVRIMGANIANKYPNETMVILSKILPEGILNDTSIGLIDILDKIALAKDQGLLNEGALLIYLRFRKITQ
ncbi:hypothetical protein BSPLISOX_779 [uncultured Gammaproteobacteria bacterium]|nr:hypothetical protein BSPLISOX_779 [uncultured Gammaproteobacteria bacterium]